MSNLYSNSIFWVDTDKIKPNPFQPRRDFDEARLADLADSIKQYGVLQPLIVSRVEVEKEGGGGLVTEYELIAGERRLRAAKMAMVSQVPVVIRTGDTALMKLELAIIENLQREDLNVVDRARAFFRLVTEFKFTHNEVAKKMEGNITKGFKDAYALANKHKIDMRRATMALAVGRVVEAFNQKGIWP